MPSKSNRTVASLVALLCLSLAGPSDAAVLQIDENGKLTGATGVLVQGRSYDVAFREGTCRVLYVGCPDDLPFDFALGGAAAQALVDQVFVDVPSGPQFDSNPALTFGCSDPDVCIALTPVRPDDRHRRIGQFLIFYSENYSSGGNPTMAVNHNDFDSSQSSSHAWVVWAVWTPSAAVPEPSSLALMAAGLGLVGLCQRRRSNSSRARQSARPR